MQDRYVTLGGLRFHYRNWGSPQLPPLVLLHGSASFAAWDTVASALADRFRVLAPDQRGHGETDWASDFSMDALVQDVEQFRQALDLPSVSLLGLSMGCMVAYCYAARFPTRLDRLVLVDVAPDCVSSPLLPQAAGHMRAEAQEAFTDVEEAIQSRLSNPVWARILAATPAAEADWRARATYNLVQHADGRWRWRYDAASIATRNAENREQTEAEQWAQVAQIPCPTLVVRGANSPVLSRENAERLAHTIPTERWVEVPDSGHAVPFDNEAGFLRVVRPFLLTAPR